MTFHLSNNVFFTREGDMVKIQKRVLTENNTPDPSDDYQTVFEVWVDMDSFFSMVSFMTGKDFGEVKEFLGGS